MYIPARVNSDTPNALETETTDDSLYETQNVENDL